ncbi:hypothetical protein D3C71_153880 [compost metagenome]
MTELFPALLKQAQNAVEEYLEDAEYNPISVITVETFAIAGDLTDGEIVRLLAERPEILMNVVELQDPSSKAVLFGDIAREAVAMEIQKNIDLSSMVDAIAEWWGSARIPAHLSAGVNRALRGSPATRP